MKIERDKVVCVEYEFNIDQQPDNSLNDSGQTIFLQGYQKILPVLEQALEGKQTGDVINLTVAPEQAYGAHRPELVFTAHKDYIPDGKPVNVGDVLYTGHGDRQAFSLRVIELTEKGPVVDGNHPFAGKTLAVRLKVISVRDASEQEIANLQPESN